MARTARSLTPSTGGNKAWYIERRRREEGTAIGASSEIRRERVAFPVMSPGTARELAVLRFGAAGARPKAYFQASLHADEIPAMLVLNHLVARLTRAAGEGAIRGEIVIVPAANPVGLSQNVQGRHSGRYALSGSGNFNRHFPDLADAVAEVVAPRLSDDEAANVVCVRDAVAEALRAETPQDEVDWLRHTLLALACDADIALDLHCDSEAVMHLYLGTPLWPGAADLSAQIGSRATLLASDSGGQPFDEAVGGIWWTLAERFPEPPIPSACLSGTVEYRGRADVSEAQAAEDADNLFRFLQRRGVVAGDPGPLPAPLCDATPLDGVDMVRSPVAGVVAYARAPGERVAAGDVLAVVVDPLNPDFAAARTELVSRCDGILYGRSADRLARPGRVVVKVAGAESLPDRRAGALLTD